MKAQWRVTETCPSVSAEKRQPKAHWVPLTCPNPWGGGGSSGRDEKHMQNSLNAAHVKNTKDSF